MNSNNPLHFLGSFANMARTLRGRKSSRRMQRQILKRLDSIEAKLSNDDQMNTPVEGGAVEDIAEGINSNNTIDNSAIEPTEEIVAPINLKVNYNAAAKMFGTPGSRKRSLKNK